MKTLLSIFSKVPKSFRFPVIILLAAVGFFLSLDGFDEGRIPEGIAGVAIFIVAALIIYAIIEEQADL